MSVIFVSFYFSCCFLLSSIWRFFMFNFVFFVCFSSSYCYRHSNRLITQNYVNQRPSWTAMPFLFPWMQCNELVCIQIQAARMRQLVANHPHVHGHGMILAGKMMLIKSRYQKCKYTHTHIRERSRAHEIPVHKIMKYILNKSISFKFHSIRFNYKSEYTHVSLASSYRQFLLMRQYTIYIFNVLLLPLLLPCVCFFSFLFFRWLSFVCLCTHAGLSLIDVFLTEVPFYVFCLYLFYIYFVFHWLFFSLLVRTFDHLFIHWIASFLSRPVRTGTGW